MGQPVFTCSGQIGKYEVHPTFISETKANGMITYIPLARIDAVCRTGGGFGGKVQIFAGDLNAEWLIGNQQDSFVAAVLDSISNLYG